MLISGSIWQLVMMSIFSETAFRSSRINLILWEALMIALWDVFSWAVALRTFQKNKQFKDKVTDQGIIELSAQL